jgi:hypothetical protein
MARFRTEPAGGVLDTESGRVILPADPDWATVYRPWLEAGNDPDPPIAAAGPTIEERRATVLARVNAVRDRALALGVEWAGHRWDSDARSRANLTGAVAAVSAGVPLPGDFSWRTADNVDVRLGPAQLVELGAAMLAFANACYARSWALKAEIQMTEAPEAIDLEAGWPTPFPTPPPPAALAGMAPRSMAQT